MIRMDNMTAKLLYPWCLATAIRFYFLYLSELFFFKIPSYLSLLLFDRIFLLLFTVCPQLIQVSLGVASTLLVAKAYGICSHMFMLPGNLSHYPLYIVILAVLSGHMFTGSCSNPPFYGQISLLSPFHLFLFFHFLQKLVLLTITSDLKGKQAKTCETC